MDLLSLLQRDSFFFFVVFYFSFPGFLLSNVSSLHSGASVYEWVCETVPEERVMILGRSISTILFRSVGKLAVPTFVTSSAGYKSNL